ncbi:MAG: helix-turn-helix transcriptional regulator [Lacipirellulaceae bacterium]
MNTIDPADRLLVDHLRRAGGAVVGELTELLGVTATAVRQRLSRLAAAGLIERVLDRNEHEVGTSRGRPRHQYRLTDRGRRESGDNYDDLVQVMWQEIRSIEDPAVRVGLVNRLASKLAVRYASRVNGPSLAERMHNLVRLMGEREVPIDIDESGAFPVLTVLACPYPTLAEQDRSICAMEKALFSEVLGQGVRLSECRLDGGECCSFEPSKSVTGEDRLTGAASVASVALQSVLEGATP